MLQHAVGEVVQLLLANATHVKNVSGRKTDVKDSEWIAPLLQHGLLKPSFVPGITQLDLRELSRDRTSLVAERSRLKNRIQKILEDANIKLGSVASDVLGKSGRAMLTAMIQGKEDSRQLADLAHGQLRLKIPQVYMDNTPTAALLAISIANLPSIERCQR
jgi:transposase